MPSVRTGRDHCWPRITATRPVAGATNVRFEWVCNNGDVPRSDANRLERYWPGRAYVQSAGGRDDQDE
jgi:hypothetical protein